MYKHMYKYSPRTFNKLRSNLGFIVICLDVCSRTCTAPCMITCVLLSNTSLRRGEELPRPARPQPLRDQFCDLVMSAADCPADEESDDRDSMADILDAVHEDSARASKNTASVQTAAAEEQIVGGHKHTASTPTSILILILAPNSCS